MERKQELQGTDDFEARKLDRWACEETHQAEFALK